MKNYKRDMKKVNYTFYRLIKLLKRYEFNNCASIVTFAYEELLDELLIRNKNNLN